MPETRFLFWNLNRKPIAHVAAAIASEQGSDIVVLAESGERAALLREFNRDLIPTGRGFHLTESNCPAVTILTQFSADLMMPVRESPHISIRRLNLPAREELLLCAAHLPSKLRSGDDDQFARCFELARQIIEVENHIGHRRSVLLGDFNMNPFESGMVAANGLHGVMSRQIASRVSRIVGGREHHFFYNPMWGHLGDLRGTTSGSYFYDSGGYVNYFWNVFDQVLMRPQLAERFDPASLRIVTSVGMRSLVGATGRPDRQLFSDHLPIVFSLRF